MIQIGLAALFVAFFPWSGLPSTRAMHSPESNFQALYDVLNAMNPASREEQPPSYERVKAMEKGQDDSSPTLQPMEDPGFPSPIERRGKRLAIESSVTGHGKQVRTEERTTGSLKKIRIDHSEGSALAESDRPRHPAYNEPDLAPGLKDIGSPPASFPFVFTPSKNEREKYADDVGKYTKEFADTVASVYAMATVLLGHPSTQQLIDPITRTFRLYDLHSRGLMLPLDNMDFVYDRQNLVNVFEILNEWLAYLHDLLRSNGILPRDNEYGHDHQILILWLFEQVFEPPNSLPVLGEIQGGSTFGPIQRWIKDLLNKSKDPPETSIAILAIWYKNTKIDDWQNKFKKDEDFWSRLWIAISNGFQEKAPRTLPPKEAFIRNNPKLLDLAKKDDPSIARDTNIMSTMNPKVLSRYLSREKATKRLRWEFIDKLSRARNSVNHREIEPEYRNQDLGIGITWHPSERQYFIRFLKQDNLLSFGRVRGVVEGLVDNLLECLDKVEEGLICEGAKLSPKFKHEFIAWFSHEFFGRRGGLPIFGPIDFLQYRKFIDGFLNYDEIQIYLLKKIKLELHKVEEVSIDILAQWIYEKRPKLWEEYFKNCQEEV